MPQFRTCGPALRASSIEFIRQQPSENLRPIIARLLELADGAEPLTRVNGICNDVHHMVRERGHVINGYDIIGDAFAAQGYNDCSPILTGSGWDGKAGADRRELCRLTANYLEEVLEKRNASV